MAEPKTAKAMFLAHLQLIEDVIGFTIRHNRCRPEDAEEFKSIAMLKLVDDDYAVFRKFAGRSTLRTYLTTVLQRLFLDYRTRQWGKWRPSAAARRLGDTAMRLERLLYRDGRPFDEACEVLRVNEGVSEPPAELARLAAQLPRRHLRRLEPERVLEEIGPAEGVEGPASEDERREQQQRVLCALRNALASLEPQERLILRLRYEEGMTVAQIARTLDTEQKRLYRRIEGIKNALRRAITAQGIEPADVGEGLSN